MLNSKLITFGFLINCARALFYNEHFMDCDILPLYSRALCIRVIDSGMCRCDRYVERNFYDFFLSRGKQRFHYKKSIFSPMNFERKKKT